MYPYDLVSKIFGHKVEVFGFDLSIYLYGLFIAIGILLCIVVLYLFTGKKGMPTVMQDFCFFSGIVAIALGFLFAKLYQATYDWIEDVSKFGIQNAKFDFENAGITVMGGFIGGAITYLIVYFVAGKFYFKGKEKNLHIKEFNKILLTAPCCITIAHAFGRIGCLMAGCCHGEHLGNEYVFGGVWMKGADTSVWGYYVPTQLYESLFLFLLFAVLTILYFKKCNITPSIYLIAYGIWRIVIEIFRSDARGGFILGLSPSQWQSIVFIAGGVALLLFYYFKKIPFWNNYETIKKSSNKVSKNDKTKTEKQ